MQKIISFKNQNDLPACLSATDAIRLQGICSFVGELKEKFPFIGDVFVVGGYARKMIFSDETPTDFDIVIKLQSDAISTDLRDFMEKNGFNGREKNKNNVLYSRHELTEKYNISCPVDISFISTQNSAEISEINRPNKNRTPCFAIDNLCVKLDYKNQSCSYTAPSEDFDFFRREWYSVGDKQSKSNPKLKLIIEKNPETVLRTLRFMYLQEKRGEKKESNENRSDSQHKDLLLNIMRRRHKSILNKLKFGQFISALSKFFMRGHAQNLMGNTENPKIAMIRKTLLGILRPYFPEFCDEMSEKKNASKSNRTRSLSPFILQILGETDRKFKSGCILNFCFILALLLLPKFLKTLDIQKSSNFKNTQLFINENTIDKFIENEVKLLAEKLNAACEAGTWLSTKKSGGISNAQKIARHMKQFCEFLGYTFSEEMDPSEYDKNKQNQRSQVIPEKENIIIGHQPPPSHGSNPRFFNTNIGNGHGQMNYNKVKIY